MGIFGKKRAAEQPAAKSVITLEDGHVVEAAESVDCLGDSCPRPQLLTKKALAQAASGVVIEVKIDNPTSLEAVIAMIPDFSGAHLGTIKGNRGWQVIVRKL
ncbi:MAG TPA: sulfurtransferase TusA family protein [Betaproteobacteria bacterium]|nr:sulfurtransferase TusA family protein [Betaproteobacteria bacterium]